MTKTLNPSKVSNWKSRKTEWAGNRNEHDVQLTTVRVMTRVLEWSWVKSGICITVADITTQREVADHPCAPDRFCRDLGRSIAG